ncbi:NUDIX domain-containing protein [Tersicoccus sp. MR15.9]|uniref:NUDIX hydrolase n=1 Tax=Tersicoccus mangrovi TaxID=3121635 RepID=UPI002FE658DA
MPEDPSPAIAVSTVIFRVHREQEGERGHLELPLVRRVRQPYLGRWALPGGPLHPTESLRDAARRNLRETTGLDPRHLEQLYTFGAVERSPSDRVVSIVYWALVRDDEAERARLGENVAWFDADQVPELAFDHDEIVMWALKRLRAKVGYTRIAHALLTDEFTLADLRGVTEAILSRRLDAANFRRQVEASGTVEPTGRFQAGGRHRPPALYRSTAQEELLR